MKKEERSLFCLRQTGAGLPPGQVEKPNLKKILLWSTSKSRDAGYRREDDELRREGAGTGEQTIKYNALWWKL